MSRYAALFTFLCFLLVTLLSERPPSAVLSVARLLKSRKVRRASQRTHVCDELRSGLTDSAVGTTDLPILNNVYYYVSIYSIDLMLKKVSIFNRNT